jgi:hypothetical protein
MMTAIKLNISQERFVLLCLESVNKAAFEKAVNYITRKIENTWSFLINFVFKGSFFSLRISLSKSLIVIMTSILQFKKQ